MDKKRVVIVTNWISPVNSVASNRMNAFVKYLSKDFFEVIVVSRAFDSRKSVANFDKAKVYRESSSKLIRLRRQKPSDSWLSHNLQSINNLILRKVTIQDFPFWAKNIAKRLNKIHSEKPIDVIISSYSPLDTHLGTYYFVRNNKQVKWIADMRDEMAKNPFVSDKQRSKFNRFEKKIAPYVDGLTSVSKPLLDGFENNFKNIPRVEVRNGFDHEEKPLKNFNDIFTMLYAGSFYGERKPNTFFEALKELIEEKKIEKNWKVQFLGTTKNFPIPNIITDNVDFLPSMENNKTVNKMFSADCNVLIHPNNGAKGVFTGKLFEYLSSQKPVLAIVDPNDVAAQLINELQAGFVANFDNVSEIKVAILECYSLWKNKKGLSIEANQTKTLHRKHQVKKLEELILRLI